MTIGLNQRPLPVTALAGPAGAHAAVLGTGDPAGLVLDAAALLTAARRAGLHARPTPLPGAAPPDLAPELSPVASSVVASDVCGDNPALLADLLGAAAAAGFRAAAPVLPALLDAAVRNRSLQPAVRAVLGERGRWLAAQRADWQRVAGAAADPAPDDLMVWQTGRSGERRSWLAALRHADPAAARDLLAALAGRKRGRTGKSCSRCSPSSCPGRTSRSWKQRSTTGSCRSAGPRPACSPPSRARPSTPGPSPAAPPACGSKATARVGGWR